MIEVNNLTRRFVDKGFLRKVVLGVLKKEGKEAVGLSIALVGRERAAALNKKYREMLFTTPGIENYISGAILFE